MRAEPAAAPAPFDLAVLYWFYQRVEVTRNHLELIRAHNPGRRVYGLFGGPRRQERRFAEELGDLLDDFWTYPGTYGDDPHSKWIHGDLLLLDWYDRRGRDLPWDSVAVVQWDTLVFADIGDVLPGLRADQVFFCGYRDLDAALERDWQWTAAWGEREDRRDFLRFRRSVRERFPQVGSMKACIYLLEVLTPAFFEGFLAVPDKRLGMLEYKDPTLAAALGLEVHVADIGLSWEDDRGRPLNASGQPIRRAYVQRELARPDGWRLFHPSSTLWTPAGEAVRWGPRGAAPDPTPRDRR